jgi:hypothetical protein
VPADDLPTEAEIDAADVVDESDRPEPTQYESRRQEMIDEIRMMTVPAKLEKWLEIKGGKLETATIETLEAWYTELSEAKKNGKR